MEDAPELPQNWKDMLLATRKLSEHGMGIRFGEADEQEIRRLSRRYGISNAQVVRILVHKALRSN